MTHWAHPWRDILPTRNHIASVRPSQGRSTDSAVWCLDGRFLKNKQHITVTLQLLNYNCNRMVRLSLRSYWWSIQFRYLEDDGWTHIWIPPYSFSDVTVASADIWGTNSFFLSFVTSLFKNMLMKTFLDTDRDLQLTFPQSGGRRKWVASLMYGIDKCVTVMCLLVTHIRWTSIRIKSKIH